MAEEGRTRFRKYAATIMAAAVIAGVIYSGLTGVLETVEGGLFGGIIIGFAAKYLWEENVS